MPSGSSLYQVPCDVMWSVVHMYDFEHVVNVLLPGYHSKRDGPSSLCSGCDVPEQHGREGLFSLQPFFMHSSTKARSKCGVLITKV
jgi:hypothetical protein